MDDSVPPVKISDQGHGGTLDADKVDGKHASELLAGAAGVGCVRADGSVPLTDDWNVGGHQIKWFLFQRVDGSFPTNPQEGMPCYRIDLQQAYVYTASGWQLLNWNFLVPASQVVGYVDQSVGHYRAGGELIFLDQVAGYKSLEALSLGGNGGAPVNAEYVVTALHVDLTADVLHSALAGADLHDPKAHAASHQNGGGDEISVAGLSGLLVDDQHVLDAEVLAVAAALVHAASHQNGGADEISVAGLSGELADDQPPKAHAIDPGSGPHTGTLLEASIADGAILARLAAAETITGYPWTFGNVRIDANTGFIEFWDSAAWLKLYGTPGGIIASDHHIRIPQGKEFRIHVGGDTVCGFGRNAGGNAYLKDGVTGTKTLAQMVAAISHNHAYHTGLANNQITGGTVYREVPAGATENLTITYSEALSGAATAVVANINIGANIDPSDFHVYIRSHTASTCVVRVKNSRAFATGMYIQVVAVKCP